MYVITGKALEGNANRSRGSDQREEEMTTTHRAGAVLIGLGGLVLLASATAKFARVPQITSQLGAFGFTGGKLTLIAVLEALSASLFLVRRTRSAGLLLVSAFLGGAIATHLQHGQSVLQPASVLALLWLGAWLRHPEMLWGIGSLAHAYQQKGATVNKVWRFVPWLNRLVLLAPTVVFSLIAVKYLADPVGTAAAFKISLGSAAAVTNMRVGFGAFPLGFALILMSCLVSARRHLMGLWFVATIIGVATGARLLGIMLDGPASQSLMVLRPEVVLLTLSSVGLVLEMRRRADASARAGSVSRLLTSEHN
jgi:hypothetical protein